jgi:RNA recognition motif-containing protein
MAGDKSKGKGKDGKGKDGKGKDGKGKQNQEQTVFVRGLPFSTEEDALRKDFEECGKLVSCRVPKNEEGACKGIAFIEFETKEGFEAALKFDGTEYGGRTIGVAKAGEGGGKGKDGKDGKDKGKGKGKDKGKKGKSKGNPAHSGSIVESTGEKKTFDDSDDE